MTTIKLINNTDGINNYYVGDRECSLKGYGYDNDNIDDDDDDIVDDDDYDDYDDDYDNDDL